MKIRTEFIIIMLLFGIILVVIAASAIITHQKLLKTSQQENLAAIIAQGASELSYLSNDYLIYRENQQLSRWQSRFASFSNQVANLNVDKAEQQVLARNIKANEQRLKQVFDSVASAVGGPSQNRRTALDLAFLQVSWSRMAVQSQGLVSDASRLSQLLHQQMDQLTKTRTILMYVMLGLFGALLLASYMLTYRRILKSIVTLQARTAVIGSGNLDIVIEEKKNDEIGDLSRAFNQMTINLKAVTASKADLEREVTQRKQAEEDLRQQREWLHVTLSSIGDAVITSDTEGRITFLNPVAGTLTGWHLEETLGQPIQDVFRIINEKTHAPTEDLVARVLNEKRVVALANDTALVTKDGREVPIEDSAAPILDVAGNVTGVVLVFHDVTEKRRAQQALREAHQRAAWLARFPDENPNPVLRASADGSVLYCNPASAELHGWTCEVGQLLQNELFPLVGQAMAERRELQQDVELGGRSYSVSVTPFPAERYANVYGREITERKRVEAALRESEKRYRSYIEMTEQLGWSTNADGEVAEDIPSWRKFTGQSEEEVKGWGWSKSLHPDDLEHTALVWRNAVATRSNYEVEYRIRRYDGVYRHFLARGVPVFKDDGNILEWVGTCVDITERKRAGDALQQRTIELQQLTETLEQRVQGRTEEVEAANEALKAEIDECARIEIELKKSESDLRQLSAALLSAQERERKLIAQEIHDSMGASLAATKFKVETALEEMGDDNPQTRAALGSVIPIIQGTIEEARRIQMSLRPSVLDDLGILATINWFCRQFESTYSNIRIKKEIEIEEHKVPDSLKIVIYRVLQEALNNIAKHSKAAVVLLFLRKTDQKVQLVIRDSGQGFDLEETYSRKGTARGLGLDSMRERTELSGGSFSIESNKGKGTTIRASWGL